MNLSNQENIDNSCLISSYHPIHFDISYHFGCYHKIYLSSDIQPKPGKYKIMVKVIDILGVDTSQVIEVSVK